MKKYLLLASVLMAFFAGQFVYSKVAIAKTSDTYLKVEHWNCVPDDTAKGCGIGKLQGACVEKAGDKDNEDGCTSVGEVKNGGSCYVECQITLCHANSGVKNYTLNTVDDNSIIDKNRDGVCTYNGHGKDEGDIIPAFNTNECSFPGQNLGDGGQSILDAGCVVASPSPSPSPSATPTNRPTATPTERPCDGDCKETPTPTPTQEPEITPAPTSPSCGADEHLDLSGTKCLKWELGGAPAPVGGAQVLGTSTTGGQVLGATTMAKTGMAEEAIFSLIFALGMGLTGFGVRKVSKSSVK